MCDVPSGVPDWALLKFPLSGSTLSVPWEFQWEFCTWGCRLWREVGRGFRAASPRGDERHEKVSADGASGVG